MNDWRSLPLESKSEALALEALAEGEALAAPGVLALLFVVQWVFTVVKPLPQL